MAKNSRRASRAFGDPVDPLKINQNDLSHMQIARMYKRVITEMAMNRFNWIGLPDSVDPRFLEMNLLHSGCVVYYYDNDFDRFMVGRAAGTGKMNVYDNPTWFTINRVGMTQLRLRGEDCVPIFPNYLRLPEVDVINIFANKLARIDRTVDINLLQMRHPFIVRANEDSRLGVVNAFKQVQEGAFAVVGSDDLNPMDSIEAFNTTIPSDHVLDVILAKQKMWNELLTLLGINNANQDKKERLVSAEVAGNDEHVTSTRGVSLSSRADACGLINRKWHGGERVVRCEWGPVPSVASLGEPTEQQAVTQAPAAQGPAIGGVG